MRIVDVVWYFTTQSPDTWVRFVSVVKNSRSESDSVTNSARDMHKFLMDITGNDPVY